MPESAAADTIRILIATDNHVGYNERDAIRGDDSWKTFEEIMALAKDRDVDMVLLSGDLFHDNKPSRKSMFQVMRALRKYCYGEKPCELEILSDVSTNLQGGFNHVNYEDPDINVAIPVFSIHGNHDDPSGEGHYCALDLLQVSGLVNYFGRVPESDNITVSPILMQKGRTKLALYGLSNVRDERLFRTFRDGKVKFLRPNTQMDEWFNLMCVHQNHHARTETGYLPENFLQDFLDLVIWGHEHDCLIDPVKNAEMGFSVIQPGSSVATSLSEAETLPKHVGILSVTSQKFKMEPIRLKTVRPFVMKDISLMDNAHMASLVHKGDNRTEVSQYLVDVVEKMIVKAKKEWIAAQMEDGGEAPDESDIKLPLIRLRVDYTAPEGGKFDIENPQRFSNRFVGKVANVNDVVLFQRKKAAPVRRDANGDILENEADSLMQQYAGNIEKVRVEALVKEFLAAQTLNILPQNGLGDAVNQFIEKGDIHAVESFVDENLRVQFKKVLEYDCGNEEDIDNAIATEKSKLEELHAKGEYDDLIKSMKAKKVRAKPDDWDSELDGSWDPEDIPDEDIDMLDEPAPPPPKRGKAATTKGRGGKAVTTGRGSKATTNPTAPKKAPTRGRGRKGSVESEEEEINLISDEDGGHISLEDDVLEPEDLPMLDDDAEEVMPSRTTTRGGRRTAAPTKLSQPIPIPAPKKAPPKRTTRAAASKTSPATTSSKPKQSKLDFSQSHAPPKQTQPIPSDDDDDIEDDSDDFAPAIKAGGRKR